MIWRAVIRVERADNSIYGKEFISGEYTRDAFSGDNPEYWDVGQSTRSFLGQDCMWVCVEYDDGGERT